MSSADVRSFERLEAFLQQSQSTRSSLLKEIESLQVEIRRLTVWIENDADKYWADELQKSQRHWVECEQALLRCRSAVRAAEQRPCTEQRKRLEKATDRRALCERQVRMVRELQMVWNRELTKANSKIQRCRDMAESEMLVAIHHLREQLERLDMYAKLRSGAVTSFDSNPPSIPKQQSDPTSSHSGSVTNEETEHETH
jgi:hypothetical protein